MQIIERWRQRENEIATRLRVFGIAAIYRIARETWRIAKVFQPAPAIRASAIYAADPGDTYTRSFRQSVHCAIHYFSHNLVAWYHMRNARREFAFGDMKIGAADPASTDFEKNVTRLRFWCWDLFDAQRSRK